MLTSYEQRVEQAIKTARGFEERRYQEWASRPRGVRWGGMSPDEPEPKRSTDAELRAFAEKTLAERDRARALPRTRFVAAVDALLEVHWDIASDAYSAYSRSLRDDRKPLDTATVGRIIALLSPLDHPKAREAIQALGDLLSAEAPMPMAAE